MQENILKNSFDFFFMTEKLLTGMLDLNTNKIVLGTCTCTDNLSQRCLPG